MTTFERYLRKAGNTMIDFGLSVLMWGAIYSREWFPNDVLTMELRLFGVVQSLDVLGVLTLIGVMMFWLYFKDVLIEKIWLLVLGLYYKLSDYIRYMFENFGA